jgi:hypothetical protein
MNSLIQATKGQASSQPMEELGFHPEIPCSLQVTRDWSVAHALQVIFIQPCTTPSKFRHVKFVR